MGNGGGEMVRTTHPEVGSMSWVVGTSMRMGTGRGLGEAVIGGEDGRDIVRGGDNGSSCQETTVG